jgi:NitT/TauT family transport system substrate-binding protein
MKWHYLLILALLLIAAYFIIPREGRREVVVGTIQGGISTLDIMEADWMKVVRFDKPLDLSQALSRGEVDVAVITAEMYAKFAERDKDLKIIAADMLQNQAIIGIEDIRELKGKRVGATTASGTYAMFLAYLNLSGLSQKDIIIVDAPPLQLVQALERKDVDAIVCWEPIASKLIAKGYKHVDFIKLAERYLGRKPVMLVWVAKASFLERPEAKEFVEMRERAASEWGKRAPEALKKLYNMSDEEISVLMRRVEIVRGLPKGDIIAAWELASAGGYISEGLIEELKGRAFWEG